MTLDTNHAAPQAVSYSLNGERLLPSNGGIMSELVPGALSPHCIRKRGISSEVTRQSKPLYANEAQKEEHIAAAMRTVLEVLGEDPSRDGLLKTPTRYAKAMLFFAKGYDISPLEVVNDAIFEVDHNELVLVKDIEISSLCEHHLVPFKGKIHIGYVPRGRVIGLSKLVRLAEVFARRLQVQERLTQQVAHALDDVLSPEGVAVVSECEHMCMAMRGVQKQGAVTITECRLGIFKEDQRISDRFDSFLKLNNPSR